VVGPSALTLLTSCVRHTAMRAAEWTDERRRVRRTPKTAPVSDTISGPTHPLDSGVGALPRRALVTIAALTAVAPLVTDLYLPGLPALARSLDTSEAMAQLTMSVCLVGLALGQLVAGPLSDRVGRLRPLRWGVLVLVVTSLLCAVATDVRILLALRLLQGLAGAAAMVVARAIVRDVYDGSRAAKVFSDLMLVSGLAPVVGPMVGGQLLTVTDWRGLFVVLGLVSGLLLAACWLVLTETRPAVAREAAPRRPRALRALLIDGGFRSFLVLSALFGMVLFTYISMSSFVLQGDYGIGPVTYAWIFGANAVGMIVGSQVSARFVVRVGAVTMLTGGVVVLSGGTLLAALALVTEAPLALVLAPLWLVLAGLGASFGNNTALALVPHARDAGAAAALLGASQFLLGAAVPPLVSLGGASGPAMGLTMAVAGIGALVTLVAIRRSARAAYRDQAPLLTRLGPPRAAPQTRK
jgi:MFS transporter, DHA1 family, multidrug resistance protein